MTDDIKNEIKAAIALRIALDKKSVKEMVKSLIIVQLPDKW